jgi:hypothetical protein
MSCTFCQSANQREFSAEVNIHFPFRWDSDNSGVFVFPKLLVCLDCGSTSFMTPSSQLAQLRAADEPRTR